MALFSVILFHCGSLSLSICSIIMKMQVLFMPTYLPNMRISHFPFQLKQDDLLCTLAGIVFMSEANDSILPLFFSLERQGECDWKLPVSCVSSSKWVGGGGGGGGCRFGPVNHPTRGPWLGQGCGWRHASLLPAHLRAANDLHLGLAGGKCIRNSD